MRASTFFAASALVALASAQTSTVSSSASTSGADSSASATVTTTVAPSTTAVIVSSQTQSMPPSATAGFNPNNVTDTERQDWCRAQRNSCRAICGGGPSQNICTEATLTYSCVCYNGTSPDVTPYTETLPYFICVKTRDQCVANHPDDRDAQETCMETAQCGTITPPQVEVESTTTTSRSGGGATSGTPSSTTTTSTSNVAAIYGTEVTTGAFAALLMAFFRVLL